MLLINFNPITPPSSVDISNIFIGIVGSPNTIISAKTMAAVPIPAKTAYSVPIGNFLPAIVNKQKHTSEEIANQTGVTHSTVYRVLK